jgi:hypothetical protein
LDETSKMFLRRHAINVSALKILLWQAVVYLLRQPEAEALRMMKQLKQ